VTGFNSKPVSSKEAPASLIAADESRCLVSEKKFRDTEIGTSTWCFWSGDVAGGGGVSRVAGPKRAAGATAKPDLGASAPKGQAPRLRSTGSS
jgi:hypothetical protein